MKISEVLTKVQDTLIERGRTRIDLINDDGQVCLLGAASLVEQGHIEAYAKDYRQFETPAMKFFAEYLRNSSEVAFIGQRLSKDYEVVYRFNDSTFDDNKILDTLHDAAIKAKELDI